MIADQHWSEWACLVCFVLQMALLYNQSWEMLYAIVWPFSCFIQMHCDKILRKPLFITFYAIYVFIVLFLFFLHGGNRAINSKTVICVCVSTFEIFWLFFFEGKMKKIPPFRYIWTTLNLTAFVFASTWCLVSYFNHKETGSECVCVFAFVQEFMQIN